MNQFRVPLNWYLQVQHRKKILKELKKLIICCARIRTSLSSPQLLMPKSFAVSDWRINGLRVADLNESSSTLKGRNLGLESTSSNCSDSDRQSIFNLSQATARIEREVLSNQFAGTSDGQFCLKHLRKSLSDKISKLELFEIQSQRPTVITPTPPGSPKPQRASTPLAQTLPIPPRHSSCITFGQIDLHIPHMQWNLFNRWWSFSRWCKNWSCKVYLPNTKERYPWKSLCCYRFQISALMQIFIRSFPK